MDYSFSKVLIAVAECENITKAAAKMGYTQSGLSHTLNRAEDELGFKLFLRSKTGVTLTKEGSMLLPIAREMEHSMEKMYETISGIQGLEKGCITVGSFSSISMNILPPLLREFGRDYPKIKIDLREGDVPEIRDWIMDHTVDVGFTSIQEDDKFEYKMWFHDPLLAVLPNDFDLKGKTEFDIEEFNNHPFIMPASSRGMDYDVSRVIEKYNLTPHIRLSSKSDIAILSMVKNGLGISILPKLITLGHSLGVKAVPIKPYLNRTLGMGFDSLNNASPATLKFIEYAEDMIEIAEYKKAAMNMNEYKFYT